MTGYGDLSPCTYLPRGGSHILSVGWLSPGSLYPTGPTPPDAYRRLVEFAKDPWQPFAAAGYHACELCQFEGESLGKANLYLPYQRNIYVCPDLITHYINAHHYQPPAVFCEAVVACPPMRSMDYKKLLLECNGRVLWDDDST